MGGRESFETWSYVEISFLVYALGLIPVTYRYLQLISLRH